MRGFVGRLTPSPNYLFHFVLNIGVELGEAWRTTHIEVRGSGPSNTQSVVYRVINQMPFLALYR